MRDKYKNLSEEDKEKMKMYQKNYREKMKNNISEEKRDKMREYQKNYRAKKKSFNYQIHYLIHLENNHHHLMKSFLNHHQYN